jgi:hypothetical protein
MDRPALRNSEIDDVRDRGKGFNGRRRPSWNFGADGREKLDPD